MRFDLAAFLFGLAAGLVISWAVGQVSPGYVIGNPWGYWGNH